MNRLKSLVALCALMFALADLSVAQTQVTQLPQTCTAGVQYFLSPPAGPYAGLTAGIYNCLPGNVLAQFGGGGANTLLLLSDFTNTTATPATVFSFPVRQVCWRSARLSTTLPELRTQRRSQEALLRSRARRLEPDRQPTKPQLKAEFRT